MMAMRGRKRWRGGMFRRFPSYGPAPVLGNHGNGQTARSREKRRPHRNISAPVKPCSGIAQLRFNVKC